jgi:hypothetical protein
MELDGIGTHFSCSFDLRGLGIDKQRNLNAGAPQFGDKGAERIDLACRIESAFRGQFLAPFRHETAGVRARPKPDLKHFRGDGHFEIERRKTRCGEPGDVIVTDVTAILAQMGRDVIGTRLHRELCRVQRIGMMSAPRIPQGCNMIDVDAETDGSHA